MVALRVPTLQHLVRNWRQDPAAVAKALVRLAEDPPRFNYNPLYGAVRDLLVLKVPYEQVVQGIQRKVKPDKVRDNLLSVLPLINDHFADVHPDFCQLVGRRFYPVGRGLMIPFEPPMLYGVGGQLYFPWFSFWRSNPLARERLSLFVTIVHEILLQDPDLDTARFQILDFSAPNSKVGRELTVVDAADIPRVSDAQKAEMLEAFAEGFFLAKKILAERNPSGKSKRSGDSPNPTMPLFPDFPG